MVALIFLCGQHLGWLRVNVVWVLSGVLAGVQYCATYQCFVASLGLLANVGYCW